MPEFSSSALVLPNLLITRLTWMSAWTCSSLYVYFLLHGPEIAINKQTSGALALSMLFSEKHRCHLCHRTFTNNKKPSKSIIFDKAMLSHIRDEIEWCFNIICTDLLLQNLTWNVGMFSEFSLAVLVYKDVWKLISWPLCRCCQHPKKRHHAL